ncbi:hypothetical protein SADUNF_Sadunf13G0046200 [Salix dunnii]|uniref:SHSP domain-containing protein n=1 Tax=Salix dunnii TaxID=1413687 RepID=A0A835JNG8_9ROSI|nr:hypothetical protein SADUNF_Sadunf13G0046200 [Salix dunnii]
MARSNVKPSYEDFEPYCKWRIEEGQSTLEVHLYGFRKEQVRVQLSSGGNMTITGERRVDESRWTRFLKEIKVPKECNANEIRAKLSTGILYIVMPMKITLPSSKVNQENGQTKPTKIIQDTVAKDTATENLDGAAENNKMTAENATMLNTRPTSTSFIMQLKDSFLRLKMRRKMGMNVAVSAVVLTIGLVVFVTYKQCQCPHLALETDSQTSLRMEIENEETCKLYYDDFEPFCQWKREEHETLEVHLPEFKKQHLRVLVDKSGVVTITGERPLGCTRRSRFRKQIKIPKNCKTTEIRAMFSGDCLSKLVHFLQNQEALNATQQVHVNTMLALQVAGVLAVMVAFGAYAYETCKLYYDDFEPFCQWKREEHETPFCQWKREEHETLEVHLPEFKKQHLRVLVDKSGVVTITGERPLGCTRRSRFRKQIKIPKNCKTTEIRAMLCGDCLSKLVHVLQNQEALNATQQVHVNTMLALQVAGVLAVMVAFGAYALRMEIENEETCKQYYDDFEPFCQWKREEHETLEVHLPEFKKQHLRVLVDKSGVVTITGERPLGCTRRSRFRKQIKIPKNCKTTEIRAMLSGGVLQIRLPKQTCAFPAKPGSTECNTTSTSMPSSYLVDIQSSSWRLQVNTKLALQVAGMLAVMVAFGAYAYCHCGHAHGEG